MTVPAQRVDADAAAERSVMTASVELLWIPLGAGQHLVRITGRVFEALCAFAQHRRRCTLYHSALVVTVPDGRYVVEMTPVPDRHGSRRGVVAAGAVGSRWLGRLRVFQYEIRRWRGGVIPDADDAAETTTVTAQLHEAQRLLAIVASTPTPVWGRDELAAGEMWNSNSVTAWILECAGLDTAAIRPPDGGRAPGWDAGLRVGRRAAAAHGVSGDGSGRTTGPDRRFGGEDRPARRRRLDRSPSIEQLGVQVGCSPTTFAPDARCSPLEGGSTMRTMSDHPGAAQGQRSQPTTSDVVGAALGRESASVGFCTLQSDPGPPVLLKVTGDLDRVSLPMLRAAMNDANTTAGKPQLDLSDVDFADLHSAAFLTGPDCSGVAVLMPSRAVERAVTLLAQVGDELSPA